MKNKNATPVNIPDDAQAEIVRLTARVDVLQSANQIAAEENSRLQEREQSLAQRLHVETMRSARSQLELTQAQRIIDGLRRELDRVYREHGND